MTRPAEARTCQGSEHYPRESREVFVASATVAGGPAAHACARDRTSQEMGPVNDFTTEPLLFCRLAGSRSARRSPRSCTRAPVGRPAGAARTASAAAQAHGPLRLSGRPLVGMIPGGVPRRHPAAGGCPRSAPGLRRQPVEGSSMHMMLPSLSLNHAARPMSGIEAISPSHSSPGISAAHRSGLIWGQGQSLQREQQIANGAGVCRRPATWSPEAPESAVVRCLSWCRRWA